MELRADRPAFETKLFHGNRNYRAHCIAPILTQIHGAAPQSTNVLQN